MSTRLGEPAAPARPAAAADQAETPAQRIDRTYVGVVLVAAAIGVPAALVAGLFLALVHDLEHWLWTDLPNRLGETAPPWYLVLGLPFAGAAIVVCRARVASWARS